MTTARDPREGMLEDELLATVLGIAKAYGWRSAHFRPARTAHGFRTAVQGDGKGFPDLVLAHGPAGRLVFAELKAQRGRHTPEQGAWLGTLDMIVDGIDGIVGTGIGPDENPFEVHTWRPRDLLDGTIERALRVSPSHRAAALR